MHLSLFPSPFLPFPPNAFLLRIISPHTCTMVGRRSFLLFFIRDILCFLSMNLLYFVPDKCFIFLSASFNLIQSSTKCFILYEAFPDPSEFMSPDSPLYLFCIYLAVYTLFPLVEKKLIKDKDCVMFVFLSPAPHMVSRTLIGTYNGLLRCIVSSYVSFAFCS